MGRLFPLMSGFVAIAAISTEAAQVAKPSQKEEFVVSSPIDKQPLHGEVDWPTTPVRAVIVMYPGSNTHTRDVPFSARGAPRSFLFRDLSDRLVQAGFATVRYDERGLRCRTGAVPDDIGRCFDDEDARRINWSTLHSDALAIYRSAEGAARGTCIIALGHSEGVVHAAEMIGRGEARPAGLIAISGPFGSIDRPLRYQFIDVLLRAVAAADADNDGIVTKDEFAAAFPRGPLSRYGSPDRIPWPKGWSWPARGADRNDIAALRAAADQNYRSLAAEVLEHEDTDAYEVPLANGGRSVLASYGWYKHFFRTSTPIVQNLSRYKGRVAAFFGGIDGNIDAAAEAETLRAGFPARRLSIEFTPNAGHSLGDNATFGPMRVDRQAAIVEAAVRMSAACRRP